MSKTLGMNGVIELIDVIRTTTSAPGKIIAAGQLILKTAVGEPEAKRHPKTGKGKHSGKAKTNGT